MEVQSHKSRRRSTRVRVEIPLTLTSMDRRHLFCAESVALVVSPQGCGIRTTQALALETPVLLSDLPGGRSVSGRVATCLPLGQDGKSFLIGVSLYNHGNWWGVAEPPEDWNCSANQVAASATGSGATATKGKNVWPYNRFSSHGEHHPGRK
jgi:hypothetical protein